MAVAVERAKQITMAELNAVMQVCGYDDRIHLLPVLINFVNGKNTFLMSEYLVHLTN